MTTQDLIIFANIEDKLFPQVKTNKLNIQLGNQLCIICRYNLSNYDVKRWDKIFFFKKYCDGIADLNCSGIVQCWQENTVAIVTVNLVVGVADLRMSFISAPFGSCGVFSFSKSEMFFFSYSSLKMVKITCRIYSTFLLLLLARQH